MIIPLLPKNSSNAQCLFLLFHYFYLEKRWMTHESLDGSGKVVWPLLQSPPQKSDGINLFQ
jgi:hypothetical protein